MTHQKVQKEPPLKSQVAKPSAKDSDDSDDQEETSKAKSNPVNKEPVKDSDDEEDAKPVQTTAPVQRKPPPKPQAAANAEAQEVNKAAPPAQPQQPQQPREEYIEIIVARPEDLNLTNMRAFVTSPPPKGKMVQCTIFRDKTKFVKKFSPKYHVYISGTQTYLMTGKKDGIGLSSKYYIGYEKNNFSKDAHHLVGKLK